MKIKKNGKVINLTEGDLQKIVKRTLNEQETEDIPNNVGSFDFVKFDKVMGHFYPETKNINLPKVLNHVFDGGKFNRYNWGQVCDYKGNQPSLNAKEFCKHFPNSYVLEKLFNIIM